MPLSNRAIKANFERCPILRPYSSHWADELAKPSNADPKRLLRYGFKVYSQSDEDGIIQEIFNRIGTSNRVFVEAGVECNSVKPLIEGRRLARRRRAARRRHPRQFSNVHR